MLGLEDDAESGPGMLSVLITQVRSRKNANIAQRLVKKFEKSIDDYAKSVGSFWRWQYLNYVDLSRDPIASYGPKNVEFLHRVAKAYDPQQVFQKLRKSGHKLTKNVEFLHQVAKGDDSQHVLQNLRVEPNTNSNE